MYAHVAVKTLDQALPENNVDVLQVEYAILDHGKLIHDSDQEPQTREGGILVYGSPTK